MVAARKRARKSAPSKPRARNKGTKPRSVKAPRVPVKLDPSTGVSLESPGFLIVGIGASAGGLEALETFFHHMPPDSGIGFVVVSHQHPGHVSLLPSLLGKCTAMPVVEVKDGMKVEPDHVYLAPGGANLAILHGTMHLMELHSGNRSPLPIDYFFHSLAEDQKQGAAGIILSGTGTDGTLGLRAIKTESGMTIAQEPRSATYQGMPSSAIAAGVVDMVQPIDQMSGPLLAYAHGLTRPAPLLREKDATQLLSKIFILLRKRTGNDFTLYKGNTIHRRIERRMKVHQIENVKHYFQYIQENAHELDALFHDLLIGVTSFFRDPQAFEALVRKGLPSLVEGKSGDEPLRVWVAGCSTGEEAYSLAILIHDYLTQRKLRVPVQIFASDLDTQAIERARTGLYPAGIARDVTQDRLQRFFIKEDSHYRVKKEIRDLVVFATHNVLSDAPFTKLDLLSCRNLLIYLETKAQHRLLPLFHYALKPNGILFLGPSESIGGFENHFTAIDRKSKLFRRTAESATIPHLERVSGRSMTSPAEIREGSEVSLGAARTPSIAYYVQQLLIFQYAPVAVLVNERGEIVYIHGHVGAYLQPVPGQPTHNMIEMAREGLQHELALALHRAAGSEDKVECHNVTVKANGHTLLVNLTVKRITDPEALRGLFMVTFDEVQAGESKRPEGSVARTAIPRKMKKGESGLRQELQYTKQRLNRMIEELQISNEELKSANEELQSTNEELQSSNEELETTKEELQSVNEELVTVNSELEGKFDQLSEAKDDLQNLLNSTEIATIFLDNEMRIKRFTEEAKRISHLIDVDVGRPLSDIVSKLTHKRLLEDAQTVLRTLVIKEEEVQAADGSWFFMRIIPYRTARNVIGGLVLIFQDITRLKEAEQASGAARAMAFSIVETVREPLIVLDDNLHVILANQSFYKMFQLAAREVERQFFFNLCSGAWNIPELRSLLEDILPKRTSFQDFSVDKTFPQVGHKVLALNGRRLEQKAGLPGRILLAMQEV